MKLVNIDDLIAEYNRLHIGKPGQARRLMEEAPAVDAIPVEFIREKIAKLEEGELPSDRIFALWYSILIRDWREKQNETV